MTRARLGALALLGFVALLSLAPNAQAQEGSRREAFVFLVPGVSFEEMLGTPDIVALSRSGGAGLMTLGGGLPTPGEAGVVQAEPALHVRWLDPATEGGIDGVATRIRDTVEASNANEVLAVVASTVSSPEMRAAKDELHPIVMAQGAPSDLFPEGGPQGSLTSDSTRRDGVVTDLDVAPTIAAFQDVAPPVDSTGSPIEPGTFLSAQRTRTWRAQTGRPSSFSSSTSRTAASTSSAATPRPLAWVARRSPTSATGLGSGMVSTSTSPGSASATPAWTIRLSSWPQRTVRAGPAAREPGITWTRSASTTCERPAASWTVAEPSSASSPKTLTAGAP